MIVSFLNRRILGVVSTYVALQSWVWVEACRPPVMRSIRSLWLVGLG